MVNVLKTALENASASQLTADRIQQHLGGLTQRSLEEALGPTVVLQTALGSSAQEYLRQQSESAMEASRRIYAAFEPATEAARRISQMLQPASEAARRIGEALEPTVEAARRIAQTFEPAAEAARRMAEAFAPSGTAAWRISQQVLASATKTRQQQLAAAIERLGSADVALASDMLVRYESAALQAARSLSENPVLSAVMASLVASRELDTSAQAFEAELRRHRIADALIRSHPTTKPDGDVATDTSATDTPPAPAANDFAWDEWLKKQSGAVQIMFALIVFFLLRIFAEAGLQEAISRWLQADTDEGAQRQAIADVRDHLPDDDRGMPLRCVRAKRLNVRDAPGKAANVVGTLLQSQAVEVVERSGVWSLVRYRDRTSGSILQGWVASSYLVHPAC